jgi:ArsR family transcriptional regulator
MKTTTALERLAALAHETRLAIFRQLVRRGVEGLPAGEIAAKLGVAKPTLSFHLAQLEGAGLVASRRDGRSIVYAADFTAIGDLVGFLYESCCVEGSCLPQPEPAAVPKSAAASQRSRK